MVRWQTRKPAVVGWLESAARFCLGMVALGLAFQALRILYHVVGINL